MVITSLSERWGAGPGRSKACRITGDPFIASSTMVKRVVRTVAFSSICSALLVCLCVYKLQRTTVLFLCHQLAQSVYATVFKYESRIGRPVLVSDLIVESALSIGLDGW